LLPAGNRNALVERAKIRDTDVLPIVSKLHDNLTALDSIETADAAKHAAAAAATNESSRTRAIVILVVGLAAAVTMGFVVAGTIVRSLIKVRYVCDGLAAGDLTRTSGLETRDEPGQMARALDSNLRFQDRRVAGVR
jgi:methyl-accepting chemotaxis protein